MNKPLPTTSNFPTFPSLIPYNKTLSVFEEQEIIDSINKQKDVAKKK